MQTKDRLISHMKKCLLSEEEEKDRRTTPSAAVNAVDSPEQKQNLNTTIAVSTTSCPFCGRAIGRASSLSSHFLSCSKKKEMSMASSGSSKKVSSKATKDKNTNVATGVAVTGTKPKRMDKDALSQTVPLSASNSTPDHHNYETMAETAPQEERKPRVEAFPTHAGYNSTTATKKLTKTALHTSNSATKVWR